MHWFACLQKLFQFSTVLYLSCLFLSLKRNRISLLVHLRFARIYIFLIGVDLSNTWVSTRPGTPGEMASFGKSQGKHGIFRDLYFLIRNSRKSQGIRKLIFKFSKSSAV